MLLTFNRNRKTLNTNIKSNILIYTLLPELEEIVLRRTLRRGRRGLSVRLFLTGPSLTAGAVDNAGRDGW